MQRHTTSHLEIKIESSFSNGDQVVGRQKPANHQEYCSDICGGCVNVSSNLYETCCGSDFI